MLHGGLQAETTALWVDHICPGNGWKKYRSSQEIRTLGTTADRQEKDGALPSSSLESQDKLSPSVGNFLTDPVRPGSLKRDFFRSSFRRLAKQSLCTGVMGIRAFDFAG